MVIPNVLPRKRSHRMRENHSPHRVLGKASECGSVGRLKSVVIYGLNLGKEAGVQMTSFNQPTCDCSGLKVIHLALWKLIHPSDTETLPAEAGWGTGRDGCSPPVLRVQTSVRRVRLRPRTAS